MCNTVVYNGNLFKQRIGDIDHTSNIMVILFKYGMSLKLLTYRAGLVSLVIPEMNTFFVQYDQKGYILVYILF